MADLEFSRPSAVAASLGGEDSQRFLEKRVLLRGEAPTALHPNGYEAFRASFLMLIRICENVTIELPPESNLLRADIVALAEDLVPGRPLQWSGPDQALNRFDAILSVGTIGRADLPWTVINSDSWLARVSSRGADLPPAGAENNVISAVGAACLGVGEVFKRLICLRPARGSLLDTTVFSFWTYTTGDFRSGPVLDPFAVDLLLIGCGAIGSGTAYLLSRLPISGRVFPLDRQSFGRENFGTSIIVGPDAYNRPKAEVVADLLKQVVDAQPLVMDIATLQTRYGADFPDTVLNGLDDVEPRHQVQQLWPGLVIDGAVGGELSCQVSCHAWNSDCACLLCLFQEQSPTNLANLNAQATGLPIDVANNPDAIITEAIIASAQPDRRSWLQGHIGKRVCSITSEAALAFLSEKTHRQGFAPAVPFVSCFSACLVVTELVRYTLTGKTLPAPRFQFNFLWGPSRGVLFEEDRRKECFCVERAMNITKLRALRGR